MKNIRRILFTSCLIAILIGISVVCFIVGRGHSIYFDNKVIEGKDYFAYNEVSIMNGDKAVGKIIEKERANLNFTGQKLSLTFIVKKDADSPRQTVTCELEVPYDMDGMIFNIPAYIQGADKSIYLEEFIPASEADVDEEVPQTDEFGITVDE